jgi:hypothetical protein
MGYESFAGVFKYAVGQPMGALSSWAMLALTHHFLVQCAAWQSGFTPVGVWYRNYAVLGDDLVIGDPEVAQEYLVILKRLGMGVNLSKSILSPKGTCLEFAKRTIYLGMDVSPITLKDIASARSLVPSLVSFMKIHALTLPQLLGGLGFGWRNLSWLNKPLGKLPAQIRTIILAISMPTEESELEDFFMLGTPKFTKYIPDLYSVMVRFVSTEMRGARLKLEGKLQKVRNLRFASHPDKFYWKSLVISWLNDLRTAELEEISVRLEGAPKWRLDKLVSLGQTIKDTDLMKFGDFFYEVYDRVINTAFSNYEVAVNQILRKFPSWVETYKVVSSPDVSFFKLYATYIEYIRDCATLGENIFKFSKPDGLEGFSSSLNSVTPVQIRFYRKWSGLIQGSINLQGVYLKTRKRERILSSRLDLKLRNQIKVEAIDPTTEG